MANYDASIRVNTKVENGDLQMLQKEFDSINAKLDSLYRKGEKLEALGVDKQSKQWRSLKYDVAQYEAALEDVENRIRQVNGIRTDESENGFTKLERSSKKCFKTIHDGTKKSNGLLSTLGSRLKGIALSLLIFNWITKGFNAMVSAMKEGFQNLAKYSDDYNKSMSALKSQTAQLKNGLAAAFEPIVNMAIPYLTQLVTWLNKAVDAIGQFLAAIQGKTTYTRAKKQVIDYAKSLDTATKSAKRALASFDELNVLSKNESAGSKGGALSGADAFEEAEINPEIYVMLEKAKKLLEIIKPLVIAIGIAFLAWNIAKFLKDLGSVAGNLKNAYGIIFLIAGLALSVYEFLKMWKNGVDWEGIMGYVSGVAMAVLGLYILFGPLAAGIGLIIAGVAGLVLAFKDMSENGFTAENMTLALISAVGVCAGVFIAFGATAGIVVAAVAAVLGIFAALIIGAGNGAEAIDTLKRMFGNFGTFLKSVFVGDWKTAFSSILQFAKDSMNMATILVESLINCIIKGINWMIEKINSVSFEVPDWVPVVGGNKWNPDIDTLDEVKLPRLAHGTVIQGGRPFAAILGDQPAGQTNVEAPLSTIEQAVQNVYDKNGGTGDINLTVNLDGDPVYRTVVKRDRIYRKSTGHSAFAY